MRILVYDCIAATPHTEASVEICIKESIAGSTVFYIPAFLHLDHQIWRSHVNGDSRLSNSNYSWWSFVQSALQSFVNFVDLATLSQGFSSDSRLMSLSERETIKLDQYLHTFCHSLFDVPRSERFSGNQVLQMEAIERTIAKSFYIIKRAIEIYSPDLIYVFNGRNPESWPCYRFCLEKNIKCLFHERGSTTSKYGLFRKPPAYIEAWRDLVSDWPFNSANRQSIIDASVFYSRQKIGKVYNFSYSERANQEIFEQPQIDSTPYVAFFSSSNFEIYSIPDPDCWNSLGDQESAVLKLLEACKQLGLLLVIRQHPNAGNYDLRQFDKIPSDGSCLIIPANNKVSSYNLAQGARFCFSVGSTITWELSFQGIRCALLSNSIGRGESGVVELNSVESIVKYMSAATRSDFNNNFSVKFGDFMSHFGHDYLFYRPTTMFSGHFDLELVSALK